MNIKKQIEELKKGCGKRWTESSIDIGYREYFKCGWDKQMKTHWYCKKCKIKLQLLKQIQKELSEEIENIKINSHNIMVKEFKNELKQRLGV